MENKIARMWEKLRGDNFVGGFDEDSQRRKPAAEDYSEVQVDIRPITLYEDGDKGEYTSDGDLI